MNIRMFSLLLCGGLLMSGAGLSAAETPELEQLCEGSQVRARMVYVKAEYPARLQTIVATYGVQFVMLIARARLGDQDAVVTLDRVIQTFGAVVRAALEELMRQPEDVQEYIYTMILKIQEAALMRDDLTPEQQAVFQQVYDLLLEGQKKGAARAFRCYTRASLDLLPQTWSAAEEQAERGEAVLNAFKQAWARMDDQA